MREKVSTFVVLVVLFVILLVAILGRESPMGRMEREDAPRFAEECGLTEDDVRLRKFAVEFGTFCGDGVFDPCRDTWEVFATVESLPHALSFPSDSGGGVYTVVAATGVQIPGRGIEYEPEYAIYFRDGDFMLRRGPTGDVCFRIPGGAWIPRTDPALSRALVSEPLRILNYILSGGENEQVALAGR